MVLSSHYLPEKERTATNQFLLYHSKVNSTLFSLCYTGIMGCCLSILVCYFMAHEHFRRISHTAKPSIFGSIQSRSTRSGLFARNCLIPSIPSAARTTV